MIFWATVAVVILASLPAGAEPPWAAGLLALAAAVLLAAWGVRHWRGRAPLSVPMTWFWPALACFAAVLLWIVLQSSPLLPADWDHPLWVSAAEALGIEPSGAVGIAPYAAHTMIMRLVADAALFWLALQHAREPRFADGAFHAVIAAAAVLALAGLAGALFGAGAGLSLPFDRPTPFAAWLSLAAATALALTLARFVPDGGAGGRRAAGKAGIVAAFAGPAAALPAAAVAFAALALASGAPSAALLLLAAAGSVCLALALGDRHLRLPGLAALVLVLAACLPFVLGEPADDPVGAAVAERTRAAIQDAPLLGTGAGAFADGFRMYRDARIPEAVERPPTLALGLAMELGIPAAALLGATIVCLAGVAAFGVARRRRGAVYPAVALSATALAAADAFTGDAMATPAVAALVALLAGVGCAQAFGPAAPERRAPAAEPVRIVRAGDRRPRVADGGGAGG